MQRTEAFHGGAYTSYAHVRRQGSCDDHRPRVLSQPRRRLHITVTVFLLTLFLSSPYLLCSFSLRVSYVPLRSSVTTTTTTTATNNQHWQDQAPRTHERTNVEAGLLRHT